jgi:pyruvate dehydrogenase E2 component (dihydrolipoamide acetyltransferase)
MSEVAAPYDLLPESRIRQAVARRMRASVTEKPHVTLHARAAAENLLAARSQFGHGTGGPETTRPTLTVILAAVVSRCLRKFPRVNGHIQGSEIRLYKVVNLAVAVALQDGLITPVLRDCDRKDVPEIASELSRLTERARSGTLSPSDVADGTFTLTNLGAEGVEFFTPIINPPQLAILGIGAIREEAKLVGDVFRAVPHLYLSLSFDHAAMDGRPAAEFLKLVVDAVEDPFASFQAQTGAMS